MAKFGVEHVELLIEQARGTSDSRELNADLAITCILHLYLDCRVLFEFLDALVFIELKWLQHLDSVIFQLPMLL